MISLRLRVEALTCALLFACLPVRAHEGTASTLQWIDHQLEQNPDMPGLWMRRGALLLDDGHLEAAEADLTKARALGEPTLADCEWGHLRYQQTRFQAAEIALSRYLKRFPDDARCRWLRARTRVALSHNDAALDDLRHLINTEAAPNPGLFLQAADCLRASADNGISAALQILDEGIQRLGITPSLQYPAITLETERGDLDAALARLITLGAVEKYSPYWRLQVAELQWRRGDAEAAQMQLVAAETDLNQLKQTPATMALEQRLASTARQIETATSSNPISSPR